MLPLVLAYVTACVFSNFYVEIYRFFSATAQWKTQSISSFIIDWKLRDNVCFYKQYLHLIIVAVIKMLFGLKWPKLSSNLLKQKKDEFFPYLIDKSKSQMVGIQKSLFPFPSPFFCFVNFIFWQFSPGGEKGI